MHAQVSAQSIGSNLALVRWLISHREAGEEIVGIYQALAAIAAQRGQVPWRTVVVPTAAQYERLIHVVAPCIADLPEVSLTATDDDLAALSVDASAAGFDLSKLAGIIVPWLAGIILHYLQTGEWKLTLPSLG